MEELNIVELDGNELNTYIDNYDKMKTITDIRNKIEDINKIIYEEYLPESDRYKYQGYLEALNWVLNGSETRDDKIKRVSEMGIENYIKEENEKYKQMTIEDYGVEDNE